MDAGIPPEETNTKTSVYNKETFPSITMEKSK